MKKNKYLLFYCSFLLSFIFLLCAVTLFASGNRNKKGERQRKIAAIYMTMNNPYFEVINQEVEAVILEKGDLFITKDANLDIDIQNRQMDELIEEGVDLILLNAVDWKGIQPSLWKAKKAGIPVIAVDTEVYDTDLVNMTLVSDNYHAGCLIAEDIMKKSSGGNILLLEHAGNKSSEDRLKGFMDTLNASRWPYHIVDVLETKGQLELTQPLVEDLLKKNKKIDVVMALNDPAALGAMAALDAEGMLSDVMVYGIDGAPEAKSMVSKGNMEGTVAQSPTRTGQYAATCIYNVLDQKEMTDRIVLPVVLLTQENIDKYSITNWE